MTYFGLWTNGLVLVCAKKDLNLHALVSARLIINDDITFQHLILSLQNYTSKLLHVNEDLIFILSTKSFFPAKHEFILKTKSSS